MAGARPRQPGPGTLAGGPGRGRCRPDHERDAVALGAEQQHHEAGKELGSKPGLPLIEEELPLQGSH